MDSALINLRVDILEVQIVRAVVIAIQPVERIHPGVIEMSGVQTQPGDVVRDIVGQPLDLIREFNAAPACGWITARTPYSCRARVLRAIMCSIMRCQSLSLRRGASARARQKRPFGVAEVDNHQIGRLERAARIGSAAATCDRLRQI